MAATRALSDERIVEIMNGAFTKGRNPSVSTLGGKITSHNREVGTFTMEFMVGEGFCNGKGGSQAQVQGGFGAAMLDAVCGHAVMFFSRLENTVATLEQKVSFLRPIPPNEPLVAECRLLKTGRRIVFLEATLSCKATGALVSASQTCTMLPLPKKSASTGKGTEGSSSRL